ncbi:MAG: nucleotidyltransferase domain-containing protein [Spirochaetales bacterium]|jgi:predicted nucleotidyltransferase|nr:nucleotidyltransferase domain-containing protein [Spirochaetales bacterium]
MHNIPDSIDNTVTEFLKSIQKKYSIQESYLFGSYADARADEWSDIDLAIVIKDEDLTDNADYEIYKEGQVWDDRLDVITFSKTSFAREYESLIPTIKQKGIRII